MNQNEASLRREVVIKKPFTDEYQTYSGNAVYSITPRGIVIAHRALRIFYPWHQVARFSYHTQDVEARKQIQGWVKS